MAHKKKMSVAGYNAEQLSKQASKKYPEMRARHAGMPNPKTVRGENMPRFKFRCGASTACSHE